MVNYRCAPPYPVLLSAEDGIRGFVHAGQTLLKSHLHLVFQTGFFFFWIVQAGFVFIAILLPPSSPPCQGLPGIQLPSGLPALIAGFNVLRLTDLLNFGEVNPVGDDPKAEFCKLLRSLSPGQSTSLSKS